uniref:protein FAM186A n=1 Tax=Jaculus jaculus TaxID=51337 RepID=UPI001E1AF695|nr:protein FAM186A [Jaculus jaculus]
MFVKVTSETSSEAESEHENEPFAVIRKNYSDDSVEQESTKINIPLEVQAVLNKIEQAQLLRAREDIQMQLIDILNNVHRIMMRYTIDLNSPSEIISPLTKTQKKQRTLLLEKIANYFKSIDIRERTLMNLLSWLEEWNFLLSEVAAIDEQEYYHWVAQLELFPITLKAIDNNVNTLRNISIAFLEENKRLKRNLLVRGTLWKSWKERIVKRPATAQALKPEQLISDELALNTKVSEIQNMLQELIGTAMFSKLENNAIKYISSTVKNLSRALTMVSRELKLTNLQATNIDPEEVEVDKELLLRLIQDLSEDNEMLQQRLRDTEEKCDQLIRFKFLLVHKLYPPPTISALTASLGASSQPPTDTADNIESILNKEFENIDESAEAGKWDPSMTQAAQQEAAAEGQTAKKEKKASHKRKGTKSAQAQEASDQVLEIKSSQPYEEGERKKKEEKPISDLRLRPSMDMKAKLDQHKKGKQETPLGKSPVFSALKLDSAPKPADTDVKGEVGTLTEAAKLLKGWIAAEPDKAEMKRQILPGPAPSTREKTRQRAQSSLVYSSQPMSSKPASISESQDVQSEQLKLESFQKAILAFIQEKTDNLGKASDKRSMQKEEELLKAGDTEKIDVIKMKINEYFKKAADTVTSVWKSYKGKGKRQGPEKRRRQKAPPFITESQLRELSIGAESEISSLLSSESTDPIIKYLLEMIIELEGEKQDLTEEQGKKRQEELPQEDEERMIPKSRVPKQKELGREQVRDALVEEKRPLHLMKQEKQEPQKPPPMKQEKQEPQKPPPQQEEQEWKKFSKPMVHKQEEPEEKQRRRREGKKQVKPEAHHLEELKQALQQTKFPLVVSRQKAEEAKQKSKKELEDAERQSWSKTKLQRKPEEVGVMFSQSAMTSSPKWEKTLKYVPQKGQEKTIQKIPKTLERLPKVAIPSSRDLPIPAKPHTLIPEQAQGPEVALTPEISQAKRVSLTPEQASGITLISEQAQVLRMIQTLQQTQALGIPFTPEKAQASGITFIPEKAQASRITLIPEQAQALGITLTPQQAQPLGITLTPQQAQPLGITLTPQQAQASRITLTPQQAQASGITLPPQQAQALGITLPPQQDQASGITLTPQQAQASGITLTPQQARALGITLTPEQDQALGISLTPEQAQALGITLPPEQAQALGIPLTPEQAQALGITLPPQQAQALGIPLTPEQAQALGIPLTPHQAQALGILLTPEQAQALGIPLTPQQAQASGIILTPEQAQALGITLTPEQARALGITLTPQQAQALGITLTPQQAQALGITLTPEQARALGITLTPQQVQALGITLTPQQAQALGITLPPQQARALGIPLTPEQAQALGTPLTPQQAQALGIPLTPQQAQALGIPLTPEQAQALGIPLTPEQAQALGITLPPQQAQALGIPLTPEQAQDLGIPLTPEQAQALGIILTPEQAQALGITLTPQQAQALGITLTPEQARALGITLTPQQAQALGITLTPQQAQALGITLTPEQARALGITLTPQQVQALGITLTPQQAQALGITLPPQQARALGIPLTPEQAQALGIPLTPEQARALGIPLTPEQAQDLGIPLTPEQAQALGITLTPEQARALGITLTPQQAQALGITLTPQQAQALGITLTPQQAQALGITLPPQQAQALGITLTPEQARALGITLTPEQAQALGITLTPQQAQALGITLTPQQARALGITLPPPQAQALGITLTPEQAQALGITLTPEQAQALGITLTPEPALTLGVPLTEEQALALGFSLSQKKTQELSNIITLKQLQASGIFPIPQQSLALHTPLTLEKPTVAPFSPRRLPKPRVSLPTEQSIASVSTDRRFSTLGVSTTPLHVPQPLITQGPFAPQILPTYEQTPIDEGQVPPTQFLAAEVELTFGQHPISGVPSTLGLPFSSRQLFPSRDSPWPFPTSGAPLSSRLPTSGQVPRLLAPLSGEQLLAPGDSSIPRVHQESSPLVFSEQPQTFQPPAVKSLQTSSSFELHEAPLTLPGQVSPLQTSPIPETSARTLPTPGKPSAASLKRGEIIFSLKSKSAFVHPSTPDFKVTKVPFTTKKLQTAAASGTSKESQILQDTFAMEQLGIYLTRYKTPVSKPPYIDEKTLRKPITSLPPLITPLSKTSQIPPSEWDQRSRLPPIDKSWVLTPVSGTRMSKLALHVSTPQTFEENRYFVDVEAQRKNLVLLNEATKTSGLPSQQYTTARALIIKLLHMDTVRLGYMFHKYIAYRLIQIARNNIIRRLKAIQNTGKGYEAQNLYIMLNRIDNYQKKVMQVWTEKQKILEQKRYQCIKKMIHLFNQLQEVYKLNLSQPIPLITDHKQIPELTKIVQQPFIDLLATEDKTLDLLKTLRYVVEQKDQTEAIWNVDLSTSSYPITEKTTIQSLWSQLGGYPDIPRLLQLDIQSTLRKSLAVIKSQ